MSRRVISAVLTLQDQSFSSGLRKANKQAGEFGRYVQTAQNKVEKFSENVNKSFKAVGVAAGSLASGAIVGLAGAVGKTILDMDSSFAQLQAQTGTMGADLEALESAAKETFSHGYGESLSEVTDAIARVKQNMHGIDNGEISDVASNALLLAKTMDSDVNEVTRGVNNTMEAFGVSAEKAFDLFTKGGQRGLNFSNEMFDNVAEYSSLFGSMGYTAEEYFGILERGAQAGVYNLDYVNDVMKEFQIRAKDGSKKTSDAMALMSDSTQEVWKSFLNGNGTVADVASTIVDELKGMDDQVKAGQIGVELFGTKFEDLESEAVYAMLGSTEAMKDFEGAMSDAANAVEGGFVNRVKSAFRDTTLSIASLADNPEGKEFLDSIATTAENLVPKITSVAEKAVEFGNTIKDNWGPIKETIIGITTAIVAFKVGMMAMSIVSTVTGFIKAYRAAVAAGTVAQWAMNAAMSANPIGLVIAGISALIGVGVLLYRNWDTAKEKLDQFWAVTKLVFEKIGEWGMKKIQPIVDIFNSFKSTWDNLKTSLSNFKLPDWIASFGGGAVGKIAEFVQGSFAVGTNSVPNDMVAQIHKDEMIIPARQAERVRQAGGTIDNIDKLVTGQNKSSVATASTPITTSTETNNSRSVIIENLVVQAKGVTANEVVRELVPQLKLALSNM